MKQVANISGQTYFATSVAEFTDFSADEKYAVITSESIAIQLIEAGVNFTASGLNQLIIVGDNTAEVVSKLIGSDVFIISACSWEQAIVLASQSGELNKQVVCVQESEEQNLAQLIESTLK